MRYFCVVLMLVAMPLPAGAQHNRQPAPPAPMTGLGAIGLPGTWVGLPPAVNYPKPWEWTVPVPAWERYQVPAWEKQRPPAWERGHVARPVYPDQNQRRRTPAVVYVMQPYPVAQPYTVYVTVPAPAAPEPPAAPAEPEVEPEPPPPPPIVLPTGSRTIYVIPGCYLGNVPPDTSRLRAGCDVRRMKTYEP